MTSPTVQIRHLSLQRSGAPVLHDVTLTARSGQIVGLLGPSGSGKSTVLRCINRLLEPPAGTVFVAGRDVIALDVIELRRRVGMVFQQPVVLPGTVADNLRYGPALQNQTLAEEEVAELLELAALEPALAAKAATELSGGQAQRVSLARTLANQPSILLMDEPTSALDPASRRHVEAMVQQAVATHGLTVLWVTHDVTQARTLADYLYLLVGGRIMDEGTPEHVLSDVREHDHLLRRFAAGELDSHE